jgi:chemosensory pili system protein ChpA (sensor histidine kinase/response regulator)
MHGPKLRENDRIAPRVLVVDDTVSVRRLFAEFLTRSGMAVTVAADGVLGLAQARAVLPDVIVSDLDMPRMNGLQLCRALRADPATMHIHILVVTGDSPAKAQAALDAGCDVVLGKPCSKALLVATIRQLLRLA